MSLFSKKYRCGKCSSKVLSVDEYGLCDGCSKELKPLIDNHFRIIEDSHRIILNTKSLETLTSRMGVVEENVNYLVEYKKSGIEIPQDKIDFVNEVIADAERRNKEIINTGY